MASSRLTSYQTKCCVNPPNSAPSVCSANSFITNFGGCCTSRPSRSATAAASAAAAAAGNSQTRSPGRHCSCPPASGRDLQGLTGLVCHENEALAFSSLYSCAGPQQRAQLRTAASTAETILAVSSVPCHVESVQPRRALHARRATMRHNTHARAAFQAYCHPAWGISVPCAMLYRQEGQST
jgi:hypothetical protein